VSTARRNNTSSFFFIRDKTDERIEKISVHYLSKLPDYPSGH
jgi:hypothetical protein